MAPDVAYGIFLWPPIGAAVGAFVAWAVGDGLLAAPSYVAVGVCGSTVGGGITYLLTRSEPLANGFFTSFMTSALGAVVFVGLWKAVLERAARPRDNR